MEVYKVGLDIGSTTAKIIVIDREDRIVYSKYERHNADIKLTVSELLKDLKNDLGDCKMMLSVTGSAGMGLSERFTIPFCQEVIATADYVKSKYPGIATVIDIGGEDAKILYLSQDKMPDLRMNGNCAGGTGAFIDQMAILLGVTIEEMSDLALQAKHVYPIASRCGVFSKTDVQNLISKNVRKEDIAASIFHAVAVQTVITLSHGCDIIAPVLFCGGPLCFIPALRKAFIDYLHFSEAEYALPENANLIPAYGTALQASASYEVLLSDFINLLNEDRIKGKLVQTNRLQPLFKDKEEYESWKLTKQNVQIEKASLATHQGYAYLGIDSGSTTTKIVVTDEMNRVLFSYYTSNEGNPIAAVKKGLELLADECRQVGQVLKIKGSCSTGYGEDLIKRAFNLSNGVIETIAHYISARHISPDVSFILDIGGQDMKAMFIEQGALCRMEINEACSSGCGSFIGTFARSLNYEVSNFAEEACLGAAPCDLGTRCTVFMNSKVKQFLREGAGVADIAAGLSYSVVKNCLYKVLALKNVKELGQYVVVQGGTMKNDSVVRAFELLTGLSVQRSNMPELMGAYGCSLYARQMQQHSQAVLIDELLRMATYTTKEISCHGCENQCLVSKYVFGNDNSYYSGNKCEKIFSNNGKGHLVGRNLYIEKSDKLFTRQTSEGGTVIGIPRALNMYEEYPFWHTLFTACGFRVQLSEPSTYKRYEAGTSSITADNICFPAKLVNSHIYNLMEKKVDRIFLPYVVYEKKDDLAVVNTYNCPIVSGYADVIKSAIDPEIPMDSPVVTFKDKVSLKKTCVAYLKTLKVAPNVIRTAIKAAIEAQEGYEKDIQQINEQAYLDCLKEKKLVILLAGRPYHTDSLIQHKIADMVAALGATVITDDIVRNNDSINLDESHLLPQWAYMNRILKAAQWAALQQENIHFVQMTSFGCGPDAFLLDEVRNILKRHNKSFTILKIDDINNIGSIKLRVRSLIESLKFEHLADKAVKPFVTTKRFEKQDRKRKIIAPFFTDFVSPLLPSLFEVAGYDLEVLPKSDLQSVEYGLKYANNEVCYPATLIVGDIIKALKSGKYDLDHTAVAITQTGGQCRASNYLALIKNAMVEAGYADIPVVSLAFGSGLKNDQGQFQVNWLKVLPIALATVLYGDCLSKFYYASVIREKKKGEADRLLQLYMNAACPVISKNNVSGLMDLLHLAAREFNAITADRDTTHKVGVVGEIFLKFHSFAHRDILSWLMKKDIEIAPPILINFFMQSFVNRKYNAETHLEKSGLLSGLVGFVYKKIARQIANVNEIASEFRYFTPIPDIFEEAENGEKIVSLSDQFGEGWLLPAEIVSFSNQNINNVLSLQPFGCIANQVVSKGVEKKMKKICPNLNLLSLDFDGGVSDVNVTNRLHLMINNLH